MQSSFGCEAGRGGLRKGGMWVRSGEDKGGGGGELKSAWMDERCETRAGQCSDARLFTERLIFLVLCAPVQAGLLEQHMQPRSTARGTGGGGRSSAIVYCGHEFPGHFKTIADELSLFLSPLLPFIYSFSPVLVPPFLFHLLFLPFSFLFLEYLFSCLCSSILFLPFHFLPVFLPTSSISF